MGIIVNNCPACDVRLANIVAELDDENRARFIAFSDKKYNGLLTNWLSEIEPVVMRCVECGHCWYQNQPSNQQLSQMYGAANPMHPHLPVSREPTERMLREMRKLRNLKSGPTPTLLDYGSGFGRWARAGVRAGFKVYAYEPSQIRGAEEDIPFTLLHELDALRGMTFDIINLEQVLEHLPDPFATMKAIRAFCHKDTVVRLSVPNILRCEEGVVVWREWPFNGYRVHFLAPFEHLHGFTPASLVSLIKRAGYTELPRKQLLRHYPVLTLRNMSSQFYPPFGQTLALAKISS